MSVYVMVSEASRRWARQLSDSMERWRERHHLDVLPTTEEMATMNPRKLRAVFKEHPIDYQILSELHSEISAVCADINIEINKAKNNARNGVYLPDSEFRALTDERVKYGAKVAAVQAELTSRRQQEKRIRARKNGTVSQFFLQVAREELDNETFEAIFEKARQIRDELLKNS